jgi:hypothetical protein
MTRPRNVRPLALIFQQRTQRATYLERIGQIHIEPQTT